MKCPICKEDVDLAKAQKKSKEQIICPHCEETILLPSNKKKLTKILAIIGCSCIAIWVAFLFLFPYPTSVWNGICGVGYYDKNPNPLLARIVLMSINAPQINDNDMLNLFLDTTAAIYRIKLARLDKRQLSNKEIDDYGNRLTILKLLLAHDMRIPKATGQRFRK